MKSRLLLSAAMLLALSAGVQAKGTEAGTDIDNKVTLSFKVGGVDQTTVDSNTDTFKVDRKIDIQVVAQNTPLDVPAGATQRILKFNVVNQGNDAYTIDLSALTNLSGDDFDPTNCQLQNASGQTFNNPQNLALDANDTYQIVCDIPADRQADENATVALKAAVHGLSNDGNPDDPSTVQDVFADAAGTDDHARDGAHSDRGTYHVLAADLSASKSSCVIEDPVNGTSNPKRIPGATIRYVIEVKNDGNADATNVSTTDTLNNNLDENTFANGEIRDAACNCASPAGNTGAGTVSHSSGSQDVTLDFDTVAKGTTECAYFEVKIK